MPLENADRVELSVDLLYELAGKPTKTPDVYVVSSIMEDGWKDEHPAELIMRRDLPPQVDEGRKRLALMASLGRWSARVPTIIRLERMP